MLLENTYTIHFPFIAAMGKDNVSRAAATNRPKVHPQIYMTI